MTEGPAPSVDTQIVEVNVYPPCEHGSLALYISSKAAWHIGNHDETVETESEEPMAFRLDLNCECWEHLRRPT